MTRYFILVILLTVSQLSAADRPNILWITSEDNGPELGCYGDEYAITPNIDALAKTGLTYLRCWSNAPVCAPARTTIITGVYPTSTGSQHMRSESKMYPQYLRAAGYYCTNNSKEDYNLAKPDGVWDDSSRSAHWKNRPTGQPFFAIFNHTISHESQIRNKINSKNRIHDPAGVRIPAYHPDTPEVRKDWAQYYDRVTMMDALVGENLKELESAGLADDTIIFYYGDHGSGMPRSKRWPYNSGLHVPLIVSIPQKYAGLRPAGYAAGGRSDRLVSFVDLAPTLLSLIGEKPPEWMQGHAFAGKYDAGTQPFVYGYRGRMDERYDLVRSVTDGRYVYLRQYMPHKIYGQYIQYMFQTPTTRVWRELFDAGKLNDAQSLFWSRKPPEELYDLQNDPDEVHNLAGSTEHQDVLKKLRVAQESLAVRIRDVGFIPEGDLQARSKGSSSYEVGQDASQYDIQSVMKTAGQAASLDAADTPALVKSLSSQDSSVRYWAATGLLMRQSAGVAAAHRELLAALRDDSPYVQIGAGQALAQFGSDADLMAALPVLLELAALDRHGIYISMSALNAIDDLGERAGSIRDELSRLPRKSSGIPGRMGAYIDNLLTRILERLSE